MQPKKGVNLETKRKKYHQWLKEQESSKNWLSRIFNNYHLEGVTFSKELRTKNKEELNRSESLDFSKSTQQQKFELKQILIIVTVGWIALTFWSLNSDFEIFYQILISLSGSIILGGIYYLLKHEKEQKIIVTCDFLIIDSEKIHWNKILSIAVLTQKGHEPMDPYYLVVLGINKKKKEFVINNSAFDFRRFLIACSFKMELKEQLN